MSFIAFILSVVFGFYLGWIFREHRAKYVLAKCFREIEDEFIVKDEEDKIEEVEITSERGIFLVHSIKTGNFLVQGNDRDEVIDALNTRYPDITFHANANNIRDVGF